MHLLRSDFINNWLAVNFDVVFISETHLTKGQLYELKNFAAVHNPYSTVDDVKPRGGISCFIQVNFLKHVKRTDITVSENIIVNLKNGDVLFGSYVPPSDSPYHQITDMCDVANMFVPKDHDRIVLGGGDLNGRVGDIKMNMPLKGMKYLPNVDKIVNDSGKEILKICRSFRCFIVNNLQFQNKKFESDFTFYKGNKKSQNDLILANTAALDAIEEFKVHNVMWNPSDHTPLSVTFKLNTIKRDFSSIASADLLTERISVEQSKPKKIITSNVDWEKFTSLVENDYHSYKYKAEALNVENSLDNLDDLVSAFSDSVYRSATLSNSQVEEVSQVPEDGIFPTIEDLLAAQNAGEVGGNEWNRVREEAIEHIRKDVSQKDHQNWSSALNSKDSRSLWSKINWKGSFVSADADEKPELNDLATHFASKGQAGRDDTVLCDATGDNYVPLLDDDISTDEIVEAEKELKEDKVSGDGWVKKMITNLPLALLLLVQLIFNTILKCHVFPTQWRTTIVGEIFKNKGARLASKNYRGISLVQLLAKLFDIVMLRRFRKWFKPADGQTAYQTKRGSADHVFLLRCMSQHAKRLKQKLFLIAIDFDGAFDRVCRSMLTKKLCLFGAGIIFTTCLASIYMSTDNIIYRGKSNVRFKLYSGIKQGLPLSPLLFLFYINDIFDFFGALYDGGQRCFELLHILIHADDATIIANSRDNAISKLKSMLAYCGLNKIIPQYTKCEFLAVNGSDEDRAPLPFGDTTLQNVEHTLLLGSHLTQDVSSLDEGDLHMKKRYPSVIKFYNFLRSNKSAPIKVKTKVLLACMSSLLHNCEAFGPDIPRDLESTSVKLLKACFKVRSNIPNVILYVESGFLPIKYIVYQRQFNFYKRFLDSLEANSNREKTMNELLELPTKYLKHYVNLVAKYDSGKGILDEGLDFIKQNIRTRAADGGSKFITYLKINPDLQPSPFLYMIHPMAIDIIRFRVGSHYLPIETGRWNRKQRHERLCTNCGEIGDEEHAIYSCSLISRDDLGIIDEISNLWLQPEVYQLFSRMKEAKLL